MSEAICRTCRFWAADDDSEGKRFGSGQCRRHAPRPEVSAARFGDDPRPRWPKTYKGEGCGEHQPRPAD